MVPHRYSHTSSRITEAREPYTREYRAELPMSREKSMEATASAADAASAPGATGGLGLSRGAAKR